MRRAQALAQFPTGGKARERLTTIMGQRHDPVKLRSRRYSPDGRRFGFSSLVAFNGILAFWSDENPCPPLEKVMNVPEPGPVLCLTPRKPIGFRGVKQRTGPGSGTFMTFSSGGQGFSSDQKARIPLNATSEEKPNLLPSGLYRRLRSFTGSCLWPIIVVRRSRALPPVGNWASACARLTLPRRLFFNFQY